MERDNVMMRMMTMMMMWCRCCCCCCCCCRGCWLIWASASRTGTYSNRAGPSAATMHDQIVHRRCTPPSAARQSQRDPDPPAKTTKRQHDSACAHMHSEKAVSFCLWTRERKRVWRAAAAPLCLARCCADLPPKWLQAACTENSMSAADCA